jgi:phage terminase large subunit-like protein
LIKASWLDQWLLAAAPARPLLTVVGVDPSDSGKGDACGLVAASMTGDGVRALIADESAPTTSDEWARAAVKLAVEVGASAIAVEGFSARETYTRMVRDAIARAEVGRPIKVSSWPPKGSGRGGGDAVARSGALLKALEVGTARLAGHFPSLEERAVLLQAGQHQPDSLAAWVVADDVLSHAVGAEWSFAAPSELDGLTLGQNGFTPMSQRGSVTRIDDWMSQRVG